MRMARLKLDTAATYHVMSRVVDGQLYIQDLEKQYLSNLLRRLETFTACEVITYAFLDNHFHLLLFVPERQQISDEEVKRRVKVLYGDKKYRELEETWKLWKDQAQEELITKQLNKFRVRMYDLSQFMKTFKQRFSIYYNSNYGRRGTLWEERFKSVLVEESEYTQLVVAAYIDLNPVRAGIVKDPKDYRWSGYGEAVAGISKSRKGLRKLFFNRDIEENEMLSEYRQFIYAQGSQKRNYLSGDTSRAGFSQALVDKILAEKGRLSLTQMLHCKVRYFSDGMIIGSKLFVEKMFNEQKAYFSDKRSKRGAKEMKFGEWGGLCAARELRVRVISVLDDR